jgi:hypothetical protein
MTILYSLRATCICRLTNECTATYICQLTNEYSGLHSSVPNSFINFGTKEYSSVIFLGTEEYKKTEEGTLFSYSDPQDNMCHHVSGMEWLAY